MPFYYFGEYTWRCFITVSPVSLKPLRFQSPMLKGNLFLPVIHRLAKQMRYSPHPKELSPWETLHLFIHSCINSCIY